VGVYPRKEATVLSARESVWVLGPVWTGVEKRNFLATTGVQTSNHPACNAVVMPAPVKVHRWHYNTELNRQAMEVWRNIQACSHNQCCSEKALRITHSECVFVALGIQHA